MPAPTPVPDAVARFLASAPKVELHLHLVGSASPATLARLAERRPGSGVPADPDRLAAYFEFRDFPHFIELYGTANDLVRTPADVADLVAGAAADLASHNVRYCELTVTPYMHALAGLPHGGVVEGLADGRRQAAALGVELAWVYDIPGQYGQEAARETLRVALDEPPDGLVGFGLAGAEAGVDRAAFGWAFDRARAAGLASLPHAGEGDGPASVWAALDRLGADRIGHGVRAVEDPALVARLAEAGTPLEVCPSSNVCTRVYPSVAEHPIGRLRDAGVVVTVNTDDPHMFGTDLDEEHRRLAAAFGWGVADLADLVAAGIAASLLDAGAKRRLLDEVDVAAAASATGPTSVTG
jgi:aminodeoxyfutalosine deaminase